MKNRKERRVMDHLWKVLAGVGGGGGMCLFLFLGFYAMSVSAPGDVTGLLLGLVGVAVMAVFTVLCLIADKLFSDKDK